MNFQKVVRYKHEILLENDAKPNQELKSVRYNREFVITVIVITEFDCSSKTGRTSSKDKFENTFGSVRKEP